MSIRRKYFVIVGTAEITGFVGVQSEVSYEGLYETEVYKDHVYITTDLNKTTFFTEEQDAWDSLNRIKTVVKNKISDLRVVKLNTVIDFKNTSFTVDMTELRYKSEANKDYIVIK